MAQVNWKVAIIGIVTLAVICAGGVVVYLHYNKDPEKLYAKGERLLQDALDESERLVQSGNYTEDDQEEAFAMYVEAQNNFGGAYNATKDDTYKIKILFKLVDFHQIDNPIHTADWHKAMACWNKILTIDPKNIEANKSLLDYMLLVANNISDTGSQVNTETWKSINEYASKMISVFEEQGIKPEVYVLIAKAKSQLYISKAGQSTNPESSLDEVIAQLQSIKQIEPTNIEIYALLSQADAEKAKLEEGRGVLDASTQSLQRQYEYLQEAIEACPDDPKAYINLLNAKLINSQNDKDTIKQLEADYVSLSEQFSSEPQVYTALAIYYSLNLNKIDLAIENILKATKLAPDDLRITISLINTYLRKGLALGDIDSYRKGANLASQALEHPEAQEVKGPRESANRMNKFELLGLAGMNLFELAVASDDPEKEQTAIRLENVVNEIQQFYGTDENPSMSKWFGMLDVAKGDYEIGINKLYDAYRQFRATATVSTSGKYIHAELRYLPYVLSRIYKSKGEIGLYKQFLEDALSNNIAYLAPSAILDYSEILILSKQNSDAIIILNSYIENYPDNPRSQVLLAKAYIESNEPEKAQELLATMPSNTDTMLTECALINSQIRQLLIDATVDGQTLLSDDSKSQAEALNNKEIGILTTILQESPEKAPVPVDSIRYYYITKQKNKVTELLDKYLTYIEPKSDSFDSTYIQVQLLKAQSLEPDPQNIPTERNQELFKTLTSHISNSKQHALILAAYYKNLQDDHNAYEYYKQAYQTDPEDKSVIGDLFEASLKENDLEMARTLTETAESRDIDGCGGILFHSRIDMLNENYEAAISKLNQCLELRPLAPIIHVLRSQCNTALGNHQQAIDDAKAALEMNYLDPQIARLYVLAILSRNESLQPNVSFENKQELEKALSNAIVLNPTDWRLRGMYAEVIEDSRPENALAIRQRTARRFPNLNTNMMLGNMAVRMATKEVTPNKSKVLLDIAGDAYAKAYQLDPTDEKLLESYSEYYRLTDQSEKAQALFESNEEMLWKYNLRDGQNEKAKELLMQLRASDPENTTYLVGLITACQKLGEQDNVIKYSQELLGLESNVENMLFVTQTYLDNGLVSEAEESLNLLKQQYPDENRTKLLSAWLLLSKGMPNESLGLVNDFLEVQDNNAQAWMVRGQINRLMGNLDQAIRDFQKSKQISDLPQVQIELARTYAQQGNITVAIGLLKDSISQGQSPLQSRLMLETLYLQDNRTTELANFYQDTLQKYPENPGWYLKAGQFALSNKNYASAQMLLLKSWELSQKIGGNSAALSSYLASLVDNEQYEETNKFASEYIDGPFSPIAYTYLALVQIKLGNTAKGIEYYHTALDKAGDNDNIVTGILNHMLTHAGQNSVMDWCNSELSSNPNSISANIGMFRLYQSTNDYTNATKYINKCMEITKSNPGQWSSFALQKALLITTAYMKSSESEYLKLAIKTYEDILALPNNSNNGDILNNLAYLLADNNERIEDAVEYAKKAHLTLPNDPSRMDTYAFALAKSGKYKEAEELLLSAIVLYERNNAEVIWDIYEHLALAQEGLEKYDDALSSYKRAMQIGGDQISPKKQQQILAAIDRLNNR